MTYWLTAYQTYNYKISTNIAVRLNIIINIIIIIIILVVFFCIIISQSLSDVTYWL